MHIVGPLQLTPVIPSAHCPEVNLATKNIPGFTLRNTLKGHSAVVNRVAWSPDGSKIASASADETIKVWELRTGKELYSFDPKLDSKVRESNPPRQPKVYGVGWSPDGGVQSGGGY